MHFKQRELWNEHNNYCLNFEINPCLWHFSITRRILKLIVLASLPILNSLNSIYKVWYRKKTESTDMPQEWSFLIKCPPTSDRNRSLKRRKPLSNFCCIYSFSAVFKIRLHSWINQKPFFLLRLKVVFKTPSTKFNYLYFCFVQKSKVLINKVEFLCRLYDLNIGSNCSKVTSTRPAVIR